MLQCLKDLQFLWGFVSGVLSVLLLLYGKPFRVRGWLHLPGYGVKLGTKFDRDHPGSLLVRITNTGSKPITPEKFFLVTVSDPAQLPRYFAWLTEFGWNTSTVELQAFCLGTDGNIDQRIDSLHHADIVLDSPTYDTFRYEWAANIKQIYLLDSLGYRWNLPKGETDRALRDCRESHANIMDRLKENQQRALSRRSSSIVAESDSAETDDTD